MVRALEQDREIENAALAQTCHIPPCDHYGRAKALYVWMRSKIDYDDDRYKKILNQSFDEPYRNSVETFRKGKGVCGEQAMLYIVLARYAGLDAVYARNYESPGHAIARVHCPGRTIDVDTTKDGPTGFDRKDTYSDFLEVSESSLDELVNRNRRCDAPSDSCHSEPEEMPDQVFTGPYFHHESHYQVPQVRGSQMVRPGSRCQDFMMFLAAASLILPWIHSISDELRLRSSNARPVLVSVAARPYVDAARDLASKGRGGGLRYFGLWKKKFDFDGDGVLGRYEASAMYDELLGSEDR